MRAHPLSEPELRAASPGPSPPGAETVKVVYILGAARSGSTLLTSLLGEFPGFFAAAETRLLWHGLEQRRCGCGRSALECPVWSAAVAAAVTHSGVQPRAVRSLQRQTTELWHLPYRLLPGDARGGEASSRYTDVMAGLYAGLKAATGANVIVDSSKNAAEALLLRRIPFVDPYVVHLIRDPRAVVFSWRRAALRGRAEGKYGRAAPTAARWVAHNLGAHLVNASYGAERRSVLRYEDLLREPKDVLRKLVSTFGEGHDPSWIDDSEEARSSRHMIGGNALRESAGPIVLREDTDWLRALGRRDIATINAVAFPLASRYGYPLRVRRGPPR